MTNLSNLFVRVDHDMTLDAFLSHVGPTVAAHPLAFTLGAFVLSEAALLALVGRQALAFWPSLQTRVGVTSVLFGPHVHVLVRPSSVVWPSLQTRVGVTSVLFGPHVHVLVRPSSVVWPSLQTRVGVTSVLFGPHVHVLVRLSSVIWPSLQTRVGVSHTWATCTLCQALACHLAEPANTSSCQSHLGHLYTLSGPRHLAEPANTSTCQVTLRPPVSIYNVLRGILKKTMRGVGHFRTPYVQSCLFTKF